MKLAFIGGGVMGEAIISAVLKNGLAKPQDVAVCDLLSQRRDYLSSTYEIKALDQGRRPLYLRFRRRPRRR